VIDGGSPIHAAKLETNYPGPLYYVGHERLELLDVLAAACGHAAGIQFPHERI
jgi:hypothetical protein